MLSKAPTGTVTIRATVGDGQTSLCDAAACTWGTAVTLTFTTGNWNTPQFVRVQAVDDSLLEALHFGRIEQAITSNTDQFLGLTEMDIQNGLVAAVNHDISGTFTARDYKATATLTGPAIVGATWRLALDGTDFSYTVIAGDNRDKIAAGLATAINKTGTRLLGRAAPARR